MPTSGQEGAAMLARVRATIRRFEASLSGNEEIEARCVTGGKEVAFRLRGVDDTGLDTLTFYGVDGVDGADDSGQRVEVIQHVATLSVLFVAVPSGFKRLI